MLRLEPQLHLPQAAPRGFKLLLPQSLRRFSASTTDGSGPVGSCVRSSFCSRSSACTRSRSRLSMSLTDCSCICALLAAVRFDVCCDGSSPAWRRRYSSSFFSCSTRRLPRLLQLRVDELRVPFRRELAIDVTLIDEELRQTLRHAHRRDAILGLNETLNVLPRTSPTVMSRFIRSTTSSIDSERRISG